jgi:uncharacterized membrane protein YfcA
MVFLVVCGVALAASLLTFFTGFGLGTVLLPALLFFFEPEVAIALTAVVHLLNGLFKLLLVGRKADLALAAKFGIPAALAAFVGAWVLVSLSGSPALFTWTLAERTHEVTAIKIAIAGLMLVFAGLELSKRWAGVAVPIAYAPLGGVVTGFFGGLSGHQGALRSAFLIRAGLEKEAFVATGVLISVGVDLARLTVYGSRFAAVSIAEHGALLLAATASAFAGAIAGNLLLKKVTLAGIQKAVAVLLAVIAVGLGTGVL